MGRDGFGLRQVLAGLVAVVVVLVAADPAVAAPRRQRQWYLEFLRIEAVHKISIGRGVVVAVVDSGVDAGHPDLAGRVLPGARSDGREGGGRADEHGHGTHMAGIIAATNSGRDGVLGIAPEAKILPIKAKQGTGDYGGTVIADGVRMAVDLGAAVVNVSSGSGGISYEEIAAVNYALSKDVVVVVAAAGNTDQGVDKMVTPANIPGVIAVTGLDQRGAFWSGSVQGPETVVSAPAEEILNTNIRSGDYTGYAIGDGTSDATAIVSGVVALVRAKYPNLDAANVVNRIIRTADDAGPPGRDPQYGFGRINPLRALTASVPAVSANPLIDEPASPSPTAAGGQTPLDITQYGARGGITDRQVMIIGIAIAVLLFVLLILAVWLLLRRRRNRKAQALLPAHSGQSGIPTPGYGPPPDG